MFEKAQGRPAGAGDVAALKVRAKPVLPSCNCFTNPTTASFRDSLHSS
jgi:hypothetical protein